MVFSGRRSTRQVSARFRRKVETRAEPPWCSRDDSTKGEGGSSQEITAKMYSQVGRNRVGHTSMNLFVIQKIILTLPEPLSSVRLLWRIPNRDYLRLMTAPP